MQGGSTGVSPAAVTVMARAPCHPLRVTSAPTAPSDQRHVGKGGAGSASRLRATGQSVPFLFATQIHLLEVKPLFRFENAADFYSLGWSRQCRTSAELLNYAEHGSRATRGAAAPAARGVAASESTSY